MDIRAAIRQYLALKDETNLLTQRTAHLKEIITIEVDKQEFDERGHKRLTVTDDLKGEVTVVKQRRVSKNLDMQVAEELLAKRGIKDKCIKMMPVLDEASIMSAFYEGLLTEEDIDTMFPAKVTYALVIDSK